MEKISKKDLKKRYKDFMTVGDLKKFIEKYQVPDDAKVLIQRVEDVYYDKHHWGVYLKKDHHYYSTLYLNKIMKAEIKRRKAGKKPKYSIKDPSMAIRKPTDDDKTQYHPAWSCVGYKDDIKDFLFIDLHY